MAKVLKKTGGPISIIRLLVLGIIVMVGLLFAKYLYFPKRENLVSIEQEIKKGEQKKQELQRLISEAKTRRTEKITPKVKEERPKIIVPPEESISLDELLGGIFHFGDLERVTALRVKTDKGTNGNVVPLELTVSGQFKDTLRFLQHAITLRGIRGIAAIDVGKVRWETDRWVVTTTIIFPTQLF